MLTRSSNTALIDTVAVGEILGAVVLGSDADAEAFITKVSAHKVPHAGPPSISFAGSVKAEVQMVQHLNDVIVPIIGKIAATLRIDAPSFVISVSNLGAASSNDRSSLVGGYSLDVAVFLASVSTMLGVPAIPGLVATGHVASLNGDIRMVRRLAEKIGAAHSDPAVTTCIHPDYRCDTSLSIVSPDEMTNLISVAMKCSEFLNLKPVRTLNEALSEAFSPHMLILAALENGYFALPTEESGTAAPLVKDEARFWRDVEDLFYGEVEGAAVNLLAARIVYQARIETYPADFGERCFHLVSSLPRHMRGLRLSFPLLPAEACLPLLRLVGTGDLDDVRLFLNCITGDGFPSQPPCPEHLPNPAVPVQLDPEMAAVFHEISPDSLYEHCGRAYDEARASFALSRATVSGFDELLDILFTFYHKVLRTTGEATTSTTPESVSDSALGHLREAYSRLGGEKTAFVRARDGVDGGLRGVLDRFTEFLKFRAQEDRVYAVLKKSLNSENYETRLRQTSQFIRFIRKYLPHGTQLGPPEEYVEYLETLVRAYVHSISELEQKIVLL